MIIGKIAKEFWPALGVFLGNDASVCSRHKAIILAGKTSSNRRFATDGRLCAIILK
jgi:hypothetical protein